MIFALGLVVSFLCAASVPVLAGTEVQLEYYLPPHTTYDPAIPTPREFFGSSPGSLHVRHDRLIEYCRRLAAASERLRFEEYGSTYERRPLVLLTATAPEHHGSLRALRDAHIAQSDPGRSSGAGKNTLPVVVWMGFTVHGNEASGANAAALIAYYLAAARGQEVDSLLTHSIVILDPCINPDGYERFATWVNGSRGLRPSADPQTREHREPWPSGRTNHYWFDLNRDYLPLVHPESRARMRRYRDWLPHVVLDFHEMGTNSTYFFQPGRPSAAHPLIPPQNLELTQEFARATSAALDRIGSLYFTREIFDDFYPGKGSTYSDLAGSIGILYEQASVRGHRQEYPDGILTFSLAIRNHVTTALATLRSAVARRDILNAYQRWFFSSAVTMGERANSQGYLLVARSGHGTLEAATDLLLAHGIRVYRPGREVDLGGRTYRADSSIYIPAAQPQYRLLTSLMERRTTFTDSIFYDVSAWSMPDAYNLRVEPVPAGTRGIEGPRLSAADPSADSSSTRAFAGPSEPVAYILEWSQAPAPRSTRRLLEGGVRVRAATRPFSVLAGPTGIPARFDAGTVVVPVGIQGISPDSLHRLVKVLTDEEGATVLGAASGLAAEGSDLGAHTFVPLTLPKVAILAGSGVSSTAAGEVWYLLDHQLGLEVSLIDPAALRNLSLDRYTTAVLPSGSYTTVDSAGVSALRSWLRRGGTLIALERAGEWVARQRLSGFSVRAVAGEDDDSAGIGRAYADRAMVRAAREVSGAILETDVDLTHPLLFGYRERSLALPRNTAFVLEAGRGAADMPAVYSRNALVNGYMPADVRQALAGTGAVAVSGAGGGRVIVFMDNPLHRAYWKGTERLVVNAVMLGEIIRPPVERRER